ncbi:hypothetical protein C3K47_18805 [Solitalea longa]|uniref:Uncharacterized protein n=1 Tax=Solitalea longa TaxID=2079460 RepID=A0A2S4ZXB3_9SPHI|nr:hypothetical protein C3K47_18805 [Solitalea longa]
MIWLLTPFLFNHSLIHSFILSFSHSVIHSFILSFSHSVIQSFILSFSHSVIHSFLKVLCQHFLQRLPWSNKARIQS